MPALNDYLKKAPEFYFKTNVHVKENWFNIVQLHFNLIRIDESQPKIYLPLKTQEYDNYVQVAKDLMESANEIFDTAKHFPYTELGPDMSQEQVRELLSVELTQDKYRKIYNSPYEG